METGKTNKVLIALDRSFSSQYVAEKGYILANAMGAEIILLHVISDPAIYMTPGHVTIVGFAGGLESCTATLQEDNSEAIIKAADQMLAKSKQLLGDDNVQTIVKEGSCAETILQVATELNAEMIIMGTCSRKWQDKTFMGSVAESVIHHSTLPVLLIPGKKMSE